MDSEIGVGRNWSRESAERLRKVEVSSRESASTFWVSMARGCRKSSRECVILTSGKIKGRESMWDPEFEIYTEA